MDKLGYAGVVTLYRTAAFSEELKVTSGMGAPEHDGEGRVITLEMPDMYLVNVYVPNSGEHRLESPRSCHAANNRPCFCWICSHDEHLLHLGWCELALHCRLHLQCSAWVDGASSPTAAFLPVLQSFRPVHALPPAAAQPKILLLCRIVTSCLITRVETVSCISSQHQEFIVFVSLPCKLVLLPIPVVYLRLLLNSLGPVLLVWQFTCRYGSCGIFFI
jgi:hypothetical protein